MKELFGCVCNVIFRTVLVVAAGLTVARASAAEVRLKLSYDRPAGVWTEALPIGNGRLGGMVFGGTDVARIQLNEDSLETGQPMDYQHDGASEYLPQIRKLLLDGKQRDAEKLASQRFMSVPLRQEDYQPFVDLVLTFPGHDQCEDYRRQLDISQAVASVSYRVGDATFTREAIASSPTRSSQSGSPATNRDASRSASSSPRFIPKAVAVHGSVNCYRWILGVSRRLSRHEDATGEMPKLCSIGRTRGGVGKAARRRVGTDQGAGEPTGCCPEGFVDLLEAAFQRHCQAASAMPSRLRHC